MNLQRSRITIVALGLLLAIGIVGFWYLQPHNVGAEDPCPSDWYSSTSPDVLDRCTQVKSVQVQQDFDNELVAKATEAAQPQAQETPVLIPSTLEKPTGSDAAPREIPLDATQDSSLVGATSMWQIDLVATTDQTIWTPMYIIAFDGPGDQPILETRVENASMDASLQNYQHSWVCPQNIGTMTITVVTGGSAGKISFTSKSGQSGIFNLASQTWSFNPSNN